MLKLRQVYNSLFYYDYCVICNEIQRKFRTTSYYVKSCMCKAVFDWSSEKYLFRPVIRSRDGFKLSHKNKKLSYTRTRELALAKLKLVAPNLKLRFHSLGAVVVVVVGRVGRGCRQFCCC